MNSWNWPATINSGTCARIYVEYLTTLGKTVSDDGGEVGYTLVGPGDSFQVQARASGSSLKYSVWLQVGPLSFTAAIRLTKSAIA